jgi:tetratricopeptide (TPR) repeat protein
MKGFVVLMFLAVITECCFSQNRFYRPKIQQYQSSFVPLPLDFLEREMNKRQAQYDNALKYIDYLITTVFDLKSKSTDKVFVASMGRIYKKLRSFDDKDLSRMSGEIRKVQLEILEEIDKSNQRGKQLKNYGKLNTPISSPKYPGGRAIVWRNSELKDAPGPNGSNIANIPKNAMVEILSKEFDPYYLIQINGKQGYLSRAWMSPTSGAIVSKSSSIQDVQNSTNIEKHKKSALDKFNTGDYDGSLSDVNYVISISESDPQVIYLKGLLNLIHVKNYYAAIQDLKKVTNMRPDVAYGFFYLGEAYYLYGNDLKAVEYFTQSLQIEPNFTDALFYRAWRRSELGDNRGALIDYEKIIELLPQYPLHRFEESMVYNNMGYSKYLMGDLNESLQDINTAIELNFNNYYAWGSKGEILYLLSSYEESINCLNKSINMAAERNKQNGINFYYRGLSKIKQNDMDGGYSDLFESSNLGYAKAFDAIKKYFRNK